jgi:hypothetical protein
MYRAWYIYFIYFNLLNLLNLVNLVNLVESCGDVLLAGLSVTNPSVL